MTNPLPKGTKARLKRIAWSADKAADLLTKAHGDTYGMPQYSEMIQNALQLVMQVHTLAKKDAKAADPINPPVVEGQTDIEDAIARAKA